ncbi:MAG: TRAP transporter small permease [Alphaproteobacteria bacterium]|nr:TRAP transporter small permease [Alphaproteobacteria bacterium]
MTQRGKNNEGRADGAPDIAFENQKVDLSDINWTDAPALIMFWVLGIVVFLQFFTRYVLNDSIAWTEETARYFMILLTFLGSVSAIRRGSHITLEFFVRAVPRTIAKIMVIAAQFITFALLGTMTWVGVELTQKTRQKMISLPIPKAWIYWVCVAALAVMTVYAVIWLWRRLRSTPDEIIQQIEAGYRPD